MSLQNNFLKKIVVCYKCQGTGYEGKSTNKTCSECGGGGVYLDYDKQRYFFSLPLYVNFGYRSKIKIYQALFWIGAFLFLIIITFSLVLVLINLQ